MPAVAQGCGRDGQMQRLCPSLLPSLVVHWGHLASVGEDPALAGQTLGQSLVTGAVRPQSQGKSVLGMLSISVYVNRCLF